MEGSNTATNGSPAPVKLSGTEKLDTTQYTKNGILRYEFLFGKGYVSSGGSKTTQEALKLIKIEKGEKAIDIGCGIGGACHDFSQSLDISVDGIDLSRNMIDIAQERYKGSANKLNFCIADCCANLDKELGVGKYGLVFSRDTLLHLPREQKAQCFANALKWLKPGGQMLITDYCCGPKSEWTDEFQSYVSSRQYTLHEVHEYKKLIEDAGFTVTLAEDRTEMWRQFLQEEMDGLVNTQKNFLEIFSQLDLDQLKKGWEKKLNWSEKGMQKWGWFSAVKTM